MDGDFLAVLAKEATRFRLRNGINGTPEEDQELVKKFLYSHKREDSCTFDVFLKREHKKYV